MHAARGSSNAAAAETQKPQNIPENVKFTTFPNKNDHSDLFRVTNAKGNFEGDSSGLGLSNSLSICRLSRCQFSRVNVYSKASSETQKGGRITACCCRSCAMPL